MISNQAQSGYQNQPATLRLHKVAHCELCHIKLYARILVMDTYLERKHDYTCTNYLVDAAQQGTVALLSKGRKRQQAGIKAALNLGAFIVCEALAQRKAQPPRCNC